jgi:predicted amidohydrolase YtcJ
VRQLRGDLNDALKLGITSIQDMANAIPPERMVALLKAAQVPVRVRIMRMPLTSAAGRDLDEGRDLIGTRTPFVTVTGTKWMLDGTPDEGTFAPRDDSPAMDLGLKELGLTFPRSELTQYRGKYPQLRALNTRKRNPLARR